MGFVISTFQQSAVVELSRHQRSGTDRRSLADAQPSLMGELKASRLSFYVAHASFHISHTDTLSLPVALGSGSQPRTLAQTGPVCVCVSVCNTLY